MGAYNNKSALDAVVSTLSEVSLIDATGEVEKFITHEKNVGAVVAELDPSLTDRLKESDPNNAPLKFYDVGHLAIVFNYISDKAGMQSHYCDMKDLREKLKTAREEIIAKGKTTLYQICTKNNETQVREILSEEGFKTE